MQLATEINGIKSQMKKQDESVSKQFQRNEGRVQTLFEKNEDREKETKNLLEQCNRIEDSIELIKR